MSARVRLATPETVKFGASTTVTAGPDLGLTVKFWPSRLSIVPRTGIGVPSGGAWAIAGPASSATSAAARNAAFRMVWTLPVRQFGERQKMASAPRPVASHFGEPITGAAASRGWPRRGGGGKLAVGYRPRG